MLKQSSKSGFTGEFTPSSNWVSASIKPAKGRRQCNKFWMFEACGIHVAQQHSKFHCHMEIRRFRAKVSQLCRLCARWKCQTDMQTLHHYTISLSGSLWLPLRDCTRLNLESHAYHKITQECKSSANACKG